MSGRSPVDSPQNPAQASRFREVATFVILAFGIWPIIAVGVVGGYGFLVWMFQILNGPPGPPTT